MKGFVTIRVLALMLLFTVVAPGCVTSTTSSRTWYAQTPAGASWARPGTVEFVREVVHRRDGNPAGGAAAGAAIGAMLGEDAPSTLFGALAGALVGAAVSSGSEEHRVYEVGVRFDDGGADVFVYQGQSPFGPGEPVAQTPGGLTRR